jgi:hypothetical protein
MKDTTSKVVQAWFDTFRLTIKFYDIQPENIYNMDESRFSIGQVICMVCNGYIDVLNQ